MAPRRPIPVAHRRIVKPALEFEQQNHQGIFPAEVSPAYVDLIAESLVHNQGGPASSGAEFGANFIQLDTQIGTTAAQLLPLRQNRKYFMIQNNSASVIYIAFGVAVTTNSMQIAANGGYYEPYIVPINEVNILGAAASLNFSVIEGF